MRCCCGLGPPVVGRLACGLGSPDAPRGPPGGTPQRDSLAVPSQGGHEAVLGWLARPEAFQGGPPGETPRGHCEADSLEVPSQGGHEAFLGWLARPEAFLLRNLLRNVPIPVRPIYIVFF